MKFAAEGKWAVPLAAVLVAGALFFAWNRFSYQLVPSTGMESGSSQPERAGIYVGPANSLAVLPFTGNPDGTQPAYLPYGFSRELNGLLTAAPGLQVTSRNSSFFFQDRTVPLPLVAERLQARHLLSGELQVSGERVRVSASLFDAKAKAEKWSRVFEGSLDEVFRIQDEILNETVGHVAPGWQHNGPEFHPASTQAWMNFLEGVYYLDQKTDMAYAMAESAFFAALESDPDYARARLGLAELWLAKNATENGDSLVADARKMLDTALLANPDSAAGLGLVSYIRLNEDWNWQGALEAADLALSLSPGDPELMSTLSLAMFSLGQFEPAGELLAASVSQDPLNLARRLRLGLLQEFAGQDAEALKTYRLIIGLYPEFPGVRAYRARVKIIQGKPESALRESDQEINPFWKRYSQTLAYIALGREDEALPLLDQMIDEDGGHSAFQIAEIMAFRGQADLAFAWLERAHEQKDRGMGAMLGNFFLQNLHADPRWADMLRQVGLPWSGTGED